MYDWLNDALAGKSSQVVTASRRLARTLVERHAQQQLEAGRSAWRRPQVNAFGDWLAILFDGAARRGRSLLRINAQQSRLLWEQCLERDLDNPLVNTVGLARLCRDSWNRLYEWRVPVSEFQNRATGQDQRIFARAAGRYRDALQQRGWIDDASLPELLVELISAGDVELPTRVVLAGFDRLAPQAAHLIDAARAAGADVTLATSELQSEARLVCLDNGEAELRAAGVWARQQLDADAGLSVAIVVTNLEQDAENTGRLLREGFLPGWQYADEQSCGALNVSYGRRLADYPAISAALLLLRWLDSELAGGEVSRLMRSPFFGSAQASGRSLCELRLRDWPDRRWSRQRLLGAFAGREQHDDSSDWLARLKRVGQLHDDQGQRARPAEWAAFFDTVLQAMNWPGQGTLSSNDFQLVNRWRNLLNEFARLEIVTPVMAGNDAVARLASMAADTVFQAEAEGARVSVLGPLEAAGLQFDRLWVCGMTANDWPPRGGPLVLVSRDLQRDYGMPDASPANTAEYAWRVLQRLHRSAPEVVFSYPEMVADAEQMPTALLAGVGTTDGTDDPGWHATTLTGSRQLCNAPERVPAAKESEYIAGGAATINRQFSEPFAAFAYGRLGIRRLQPFTPGISGPVRGKLMHAALQALYADAPSQRDISRWTEADRKTRITRAVDRAFAPYERHADNVLRRLLGLEKRRSMSLLEEVVQIDLRRPAFSIDSVETRLAIAFGAIQLELRCDRIDKLGTGEYVILDYKTGQKRGFLQSGTPRDRQLVVYACAIDAPVAGLGLFNVDSKHTLIDGAGPALAPIADWDRVLAEWQREVRDEAARIAAGDVRINVRLPGRDARPLSLLSRIAEVRREL